MNHSTFGQLLIQDLQENLDLLIRGLNSPYSIFGFFPTMGWNIQGLASSNLPLITEKFVAIRQGLTELIKEEELTQAEVNSLGQQLESNFEVFCQEVMAGYFNNVTDEQMESFVKDTAQYLLVLFLAKNYPLLLQLSELIGVIKYETQEEIYLEEGGEYILLREQIPVYQLKTSHFLSLPLNFINEFISGLDLESGIGIEQFFEVLNQKLDEAIKEIRQVYGESLAEGIEVRLNSQGLTILGNVFKLSVLPEPLTFQLPPNDKLTLQINGNEFGLLWGELLDDINNTVPLISAGGIQLKLGETDILNANAELVLHISDTETYFELKGQTGLQLPADLIDEVEGELKSTAHFVYHYDIGGAYNLNLTDFNTSGSLRIGGAGGVQLSECNLNIQDISYPLPATGLDLKFQCTGTLSWQASGSVSQLQVKADYTNERLILSADADMYLGSGIWLQALEEQPIFHGEIHASGTYTLDVNALFKMPHQNGSTKDIEVQGNLTLVNTNGQLQLTQFSAASQVNNLTWELPGGIVLKSAHVRISNENQTFSAVIGGLLDLEGGQSVQITTAMLFPNVNDPTNIKIDTQVVIDRLNFFDQLYLFEGKVQLRVATKPLSGTLEIIESSAGFIAKGNLSIHPGLSDFHLAVEQLDSTFEFNTNGFELQLQSGSIFLPEVFNHGGTERASANIGDQPISLVYENQQLVFQMALVLSNFGIDFSENAGLVANLETAILSMSSSEPIPRITDAKGHIILPIPEQASINIAFDKVTWDILGYPDGVVHLTQNIIFPLGGGFELELLGGSQNGIQTGLTVIRNDNAQPQFILDGAVNLILPIDMLTKEEGDQIYIGSSGNISWRAGEMPVPHLEELRIGGNFRLGGTGGIKIQDGELTAAGIENMLKPSNDHPFLLLLSGKLFLGDDGPGAGINDASFTFIGDEYPLFDFQGFSIKPGEEQLGVMEQLPLKVRDLEVAFIEPDPLPAKLDPTNIRVTLSAELEIPLSSGSLLGMVDGISVHFNEHGIPIRKDGNPGIDIEGIGVGIDGFEAGGMLLTGVVYLGGLDDPEDLFFAGKVGGKFNGTGVSALLALGMKGPRGLCLEVSGGSAGITLPYGFLLTGAEGGVVFPNLDGRVSNADPCDIRTYITLNDEGRPERTNQAPKSRQEIPSDEKVIQQSDEATVSEGAEFSCPQGQCPPPAVSIISQPHPDRQKYPDRVIIKFTSIDEVILNELGITPEFFAQLGLTTPEEIAEVTVGNIFNLVEENFPDLSTLSLTSETQNEVNELAGKLKNDTRSMLINQFSSGIQLALMNNNSVYEAVKEMAYAGIPSPETTLKLTGTFSYSGISTFLSITGGFSISTVMIPQPVPLISTVGILGSINLLGIPMGTARLFLNTTDASGTPLLLPTICGDVHVAIGPIEFGQLRMKFEAEGLTQGLANASVTFAEHLSAPLVHELVNLVVREVLEHPDYDPNQPESALSLLSFQQLVSFSGALINLPSERITPEILDCLIELTNNAWESFDPKFLLCGQVQPKIFGLGLGSELTSAKINIDKTSYAAQFGISPSAILSYVFGSIFPAIDKATVGMAFKLPDPVGLMNKMLTTDMRSLQEMTAYLQEGFEHVLENATYTVEYELTPMGLKMADAEARLLMPDLMDHPASPSSTWKRPEDRTNENYISRLQLLLRALDANVLANPLWKGSSEDLNVLTVNNTYGLSFKNYFPHGGFLGAAKLSVPLVLLDGIPPQLIAEMLNSSDMLQRFNVAKNILENYILKTENIGQLAFYVPFPNPPTFTIDGQDPTPMQIVKKMQEDGFDWSDVEAGDLLSVEQAFFKGHIQNARLLGIPIFDARVTAYGPDATTNSPGLFEISAAIPQNSWLSEFIDSAEMRFTLSQSPVRPVDEYFSELLALMQYHKNHSGRLSNTGTAVEIFSNSDFSGEKQFLEIGTYRTKDLKIGNDQLSSIRIPQDAGLQVILYEGDNFQGRNIVLTGSINGLGNFNEIVSSIRVLRTTPLDNLVALFTEGLPKMIMQTEVDKMRIPDVLTNFIRVEANTSLAITAYSPFYNPNAVGTDLNAQLKRNGGTCFTFKCKFGISNIFEVDVPKAQFALLPFNDTSILPKILGEFVINKIDLPFGLAAIEQARIYFNSAPKKGENLLEIKGNMSHLPLGLFNLVPLRGKWVSTTLTVGNVNNSGNFTTSLSALRFQKAGFIRSDLALYGSVINQPINIHSAAIWNAKVAGRSIALFVGAIEVLRLSSGTTLSGSVKGKGFSTALVQLTLPVDVKLTAFPGHAILKQRLSSPNGGQATLTINSNGTFSLKAIAAPFNFGLIQISGAGNQNFGVQISNQGFKLSAGAQLNLKGITRKPYNLKQFQIRTDTTFSVVATGGKIGMAQFFEITGGKLQVNRGNSQTSISVVSPSFYLFPATSFSNQLSVGNFFINSNGYFGITSANQSINLPRLVKAKGSFQFSRNQSGVSGKLNKASVKLLPLNLNLSGNAVISSNAIQISLVAKAYKVSGLIDISPASWQLDWQKQKSFSLKAISPTLKILNKSLTPLGQFVFNCKDDSSFLIRFSTNSELNILSGLLEIGPATVDFSKSKASIYNLKLQAKVKVLKNPASGQWILNQTTEINLANGNFKKEITALRNKTFADVGLAKLYSNSSSRTYLAKSSSSYYFEFSKLKFWVMNIENTVSGSCTSSGGLKLKWTTAKELQLGPFRLPSRKAEVVTNLKNRSFSVKIPAGKLKAPNVTGFPTSGINIPQLNINTSGDFVTNLSAFAINGINLSTSGSNNTIKLYGKDKRIKIRNKESLWGASADLSLDIKSDGAVSGYIRGSFKLRNITVGSVKFSTINLGSVTLTYNASRSDYQFEGKVTLNNVSGKKKKTTFKTKNVWNILKGIFETVTETIVTWAARTFKIRVTLKFGSAGSSYRIKIL